MQMRKSRNKLRTETVAYSQATRSRSLPVPAKSAMMSKVRRAGTAPELVVRELVADLGVIVRTNCAELPGSPDLCSLRRKVALFVHGCFWHRHPRCSRSSTPRTNVQFWEKKFERNVARDRAANRALRRMGFLIVVIWGCETRDPERLRERLALAFQGSRPRGRPSFALRPERRIDRLSSRRTPRSRGAEP
jgi:DNA mismatch endonuclease, patch repair protein